MSALNPSVNRSLSFQAQRWLRGILPPGTLGKYILAVGIVGILLLVYAGANVPLARPEILIALFILSIATEWAPVNLSWTPLQGTSLSVSAAMSFAALLMVGPSGAILVNLGSSLAYSLKENRPFYKRWFTTSALLTSAAAAGVVYVILGGGSPLLFRGQDFLAAGLAAAAYFATNSALISGAVSLASGRPFQSVLGNWQWLFLQMFCSLAIGLVIALAYASGINTPTFLMLGGLLVLPWYSTYVYVQKSRQVAEQNDKLQKANVQLELANRQLDLQIGGMRALHNISLSLNSSQSLPAIFDQILTFVLSLTHAESAAVFLYNGSQQKLQIAGQVGLSEKYLERPEMALDGSARRALQENRILVMDQNNYNPSMLSAPAVMDGIRTAACLPLNVNGQVVGGLDVSFKSEHTFGADELDLLKTLAEQAAVAIQNAQLTEQIHESYLSTIRALAATVEAKDAYTRGHSEVVRQLAIATGRQLGLSNTQLETLNIAALFHDIGKIAVPESILNKPGKLTEEEWVTMRHHPIVGENILRKVPALAEVATIVRHHHERYDGRGYPDQISSHDHLLAAIISVCDTYQAMTSDRPYRSAMPHPVAVHEIRKNAGSQFVPEVVDAFIAAIEYQDFKQSQSGHLEPCFALRTPRSDGMVPGLRAGAPTAL